MFFDFAYRVAAIALCFCYGETVWQAFAERKITLFNSDFFGPARYVFQRDATPIRFWIVLCMNTGTTLLCFVAAIIGWWDPKA